MKYVPLIVGYIYWGQEYGMVEDLDSRQNLALGKFLFRLGICGKNDQKPAWILRVTCCP